MKKILSSYAPGLFLMAALASFTVAYGEDNVGILKKEIHKKRIEIVNTETEAQALLQTNWKEYSEKIKEVERKEGELEILEKQLKGLEEQ